MMANNIAMGFQGIQLPDPLNAYAKVMSIQNAQNQNALAQYQMASAQRADADQNKLRETLAGFKPGMKFEDQYNALISTGNLDAARKFAESHAKVSKDQREGEKSQMDMVHKKMEISRDFLSGVDPNAPTTPNVMMQWFKGALNDPHIGPLMAQYGATETNLADSVEQAIKTPGGMDKLVNDWRLGTTAYAKMNKPHFVNQTNGATNQTLSIPGMGGPATVVPGSVSNVTSTPHQLALEAQSAQNTGIAAQRLELDRQRVAAKLDDVKLKMIPPHVNTAIIKNDQSISKIDKAIGLLEGTIEGGDKEATGLKGYLPDQVLSRAYPEGNATRAVIADIGSLKLHDRSGAAITASEFPRLAPFIPSSKDTPAAALVKLRQLREAAAGEQEALQQTYSEGQGYRSSPVGKKSAPSTLDSLLDKYK